MKTLTVKQIKTHLIRRHGEPPPPQHAYKVMQVTDSITPHINDIIHAHDLQDLYCDSEHWKVTIK
jgi:hypothetical protein